MSCGLGEQIRQRMCNIDNMTLDSRLKIDYEKCEGERTDIRSCFKECQVGVII